MCINKLKRAAITATTDLHVDAEVGSGGAAEVHGVGDEEVQLVRHKPQPTGVRQIHRERVHLCFDACMIRIRDHLSYVLRIY